MRRVVRAAKCILRFVVAVKWFGVCVFCTCGELRSWLPSSALERVFSCVWRVEIVDCGCFEMVWRVCFCVWRKVFL